MFKIFSFIQDSLLEYKILLKYWLLFLFVGFFFRVILLVLFSNNYDTELYTYTILYGFRMDTIAFSSLWIIFLVFYTLNLKTILRMLLTFSMSIYLIIELSSILFLAKFVSRPNYLFIEHLNNYDEILNMIIKLYPVYSIAFVVIVCFMIYKVYMYFYNTLHNGSIRKKLVLFPFVLILLLGGARSSLGSSTPNQGFYTFSKINIYNDIANNSIFSILYATYLSKKEKEYFYGKLSNTDALLNIKKEYKIHHNLDNLRRFQKSHNTDKKNIILVILESFGHKYIGHLGGINTTPNLDNLTKESLYFTNMYATGTRTSWGISSILTSLYPIPSREYVKASKSQKDFYTMAKTLKKFDYKNVFLYSGDVDFDNMRGFLLSNGYDDVLGKENFSIEATKYTWGYSDEALYDKALKFIDKNQDKPFFLTLLTLSSHEPFDYPKNKVAPYKKESLYGFANSIKYADYALGKFVQTLKDKDLMKNTVVAFIADHNENAYSSLDVPVNKYKIASLILANEYKNNSLKYEKIASQIDFAPTILDIAGIDSELPTMGASVLKHQRNSALLLAKQKNFVYLLEDKLILYKPKAQTQTYDYLMNKLPNNKKDTIKGLSYIKGANYLYKNKLYK